MSTDDSTVIYNSSDDDTSVSSSVYVSPQQQQYASQNSRASQASGGRRGAARHTRNPSSASASSFSRPPRHRRGSSRDSDTLTLDAVEAAAAAAAAAAANEATATPPPPPATLTSEVPRIVRMLPYSIEFDVALSTEWQPDDTATRCSVCRSEFKKALARKHHCRRCGLVVCTKCSMFNARICGAPIEVRVCRYCHVLLNTEATPSVSEWRELFELVVPAVSSPVASQRLLASLVLRAALMHEAARRAFVPRYVGGLLGRIAVTSPDASLVLSGPAADLDDGDDAATAAAAAAADPSGSMLGVASSRASARIVAHSCLAHILCALANLTAASSGHIISLCIDLECLEQLIPFVSPSGHPDHLEPALQTLCHLSRLGSAVSRCRTLYPTSLFLALLTSSVRTVRLLSGRYLLSLATQDFTCFADLVREQAVPILSAALLCETVENSHVLLQLLTPIAEKASSLGILPTLRYAGMVRTLLRIISSPHTELVTSAMQTLALLTSHEELFAEVDAKQIEPIVGALSFGPPQLRTAAAVVVASLFTLDIAYVRAATSLSQVFGQMLDAVRNGARRAQTAVLQTLESLIMLDELRSELASDRILTALLDALHDAQPMARLLAARSLIGLTADENARMSLEEPAVVQQLTHMLGTLQLRGASDDGFGSDDSLASELRHLLAVLSP